MKLFIIFASCFFAPICFGEHVYLKSFADNRRFGDVYHLSLQGLASSDSHTARIHQRNAARASLMMGDFESSIFHLREIINKNPAKDPYADKILLAYNYLLLEDLSMWRQSAPSSVHPEIFAILEAIDGPQSSSSLEALTELSSSNSLSEETRQTLLDYTRVSRKSPYAAGTLNLLLPGSGYAYLGMWQTAALSFLLTGLCVFAAREQFLDHKPLTGTAVAMVGSVFYIGGAIGAAQSAYDLNRKNTSGMRTKLREFALPELKVEWNF